MRESPTSIADSLMDAGALLDGRYRLDALVHRSATATIHVAMHRNGSTAWLKLPADATHGELIAREAGIANLVGSPLVVRDDGTTPDGVPYLVIDPPDAESIAKLRARARAGSRLTLARVMTAGDALLRVVAAIHGMSYATAGLGDEEVLVLANGDVALLDLHALVPATPQSMAADVKHLVRVLSTLFTEVAGAHSSAPASALIRGALAASYPNVAALQAGWRAAAPEPIQPPSRTRLGSLSDFPSTPVLPAHSTPLSMSVDKATPPSTSNDSVIGYLRSGALSVPPPSREGPREVLSDPISKPSLMPRLVQATSLAPSRSTRHWSSRVLIGVMIAAPVISLIGISTLVLSWRSTAQSAPATAALEPRATTEVPAAEPLAVPAPPPAPAPLPRPSMAAPSPVAVPSESNDDLELTTSLRSEGAPPDRDVFIDGKPVGKTPLRVTVPCGSHTLQMVAGAPKQTVELPCGGERVVRYDAKGHWAIRAE